MNMKHIESIFSTADLPDFNEPAGDEGFCFDLCLPPLMPVSVEPWLSTRAIFFAEGELPVPVRRWTEASSTGRSPEFVRD